MKQYIGTRMPGPHGSLPVVAISFTIGLFAAIVAVWVLDLRLRSDTGFEMQLNQSQANFYALQVTTAQLENDLDQMDLAYKDLLAKLSSAESISIAVKEQLTQANQRAASGTSDLSVALEKISTLESEVESTYSQSTEEGKSILALRDMADSIERHRLLLVELRRNPPQRRTDSLDYWRDVKELAIKADPSLSSSVDKVIIRIDSYFNWSETNPAPASSAEEYVQWLEAYNTSGAVDYEQAAYNFSREAMRSVINQLDSALNYLH